MFGTSLCLAVLTLLEAETAEVVTRQTVWEFLSSGGPVMVPIAICSIVALAFGLERLMNLKEHKVVPERIDQAVELLRIGQPDKAMSYSEEMDLPASRILAAGIRRWGRPLEDIERAMEDQGHKENEKLRSNIRPLHIIANVAPLLGLLGTVMGIQESFHRVVKSGLGKPEHLAGGIEEALVTTISGLVVAIPALLLAAHLSAKVRKLMIRTDEKLAPVVELLEGEHAPY